MSSNILVGNVASGLWVSLGSPSSVSALTISGYFVFDSTLGSLNSKLGTCFQSTGSSGVGFGYDATPDLCSTELAIEALMFTISYYGGLATNTMGAGGMGVGGLPFVNIAEGDTKLGTANPAAIGAVYLGMATQATKDLNYLVNQYVLNSQGGDTPRSVSNPNVVFGTWSQAGWGLG